MLLFSDRSIFRGFLVESRVSLCLKKFLLSSNHGNRISVFQVNVATQCDPCEIIVLSDSD